MSAAIAQPDASAIAEAVRERYRELTRRGRQSTLLELDEIVQIQRLLLAHSAYERGDGHAT